jgi:N-acyl-D-amino-acid deacylase
VLNSNKLDLQRFIYSSTGQTAGILGLADRGLIKTGLKADIVIFDPKNYHPEADFKAWDRLSKGVSHLVINGMQVIVNGNYSGALAGQFVARNQK